MHMHCTAGQHCAGVANNLSITVERREGEVHVQGAQLVGDTAGACAGAYAEGGETSARWGFGGGLQQAAGATESS